MIHIIRKELRDALHNRWLIGYAVLLAVLGFVAALMGVRSAAGLGLQMFGRTTATLTNLCLLLAPLTALSMGSASIAGERDRGTLEHLLAQPLERSELLLGKYLGLLTSLCLATLVGFFPAGLMVAISAGGVALAHYLIFPLLAILLIAAMLALGMLISVRSRGGVQAQGRAILLWFLFVLLYDLLLMGTLVTAGLSGGALAILLLINPVDAARVLVVLALEPDLYLLGPAGALLVGHLSRWGTAAVLVASMLVWTVVPLLLALLSFRIRPQAPRNRKVLVDEEWRASETEDEVVVGVGLRQDARNTKGKHASQLSRTWMVTVARVIGLARSEP
jgi:Cu-processing system permease protein